MKIKNNYNECLTNLACSIAKYFGASYKHNTIDYIDKILKELKYSHLDRLKTLENVLNAKISTHIFEQPLIQKKINLR